MAIPSRVKPGWQLYVAVEPTVVVFSTTLPFLMLGSLSHSITAKVIIQPQCKGPCFYRMVTFLQVESLSIEAYVHKWEHLQTIAH